MKYKKFSELEKKTAVKSFLEGKTRVQICGDLGIDKSTFRYWIRKYSDYPIRKNNRKRIILRTKNPYPTKLVCYTLDKETSARFDEYAKNNKINKSGLVNMLIQRELDNAKPNNKSILNANIIILTETVHNLQLLMSQI